MEFLFVVSILELSGWFGSPWAHKINVLTSGSLSIDCGKLVLIVVCLHHEKRKYGMEVMQKGNFKETESSGTGMINDAVLCPLWTLEVGWNHCIYIANVEVNHDF